MNLKINFIYRHFIYELIVCVIIVSFSVVNVYYSALFGQYSASRTVVYYLIGGIIGTEFIYTTLNFNRYVKPNWFTTKIMLILIYIFILNQFCNVSPWSVIVQCGTLVLWIVTYKYFFKSLEKDPEILNLYYKLMVFLFYIFAILSIFAQKDIAETRGQSVAVVNLSYYCLACFPITIIKRTRANIVHILTAILISIYSLKRGAILTLVLMLLVMYYVNGKVEKKTFSNWIKILMISALVAVVLATVDYYSNGVLSSRFSRDSLADGSGRSRMVSTAIEMFKERSFIYRLFGTGTGTSSLTVGITLHNDYLEFLYCFGYIGLIMYGVLILSIINKLREKIKMSSRNTTIFAMISAFILGLSIFEGVIFNFAFLYVVIQISVIDFLEKNTYKNNEVYNET